MSYRVKDLLMSLLAFICLTAGLVAITLYVMSDPVVQKEYTTGRVVAVITRDGISHSPSYLTEHNIRRYDIVWVRPATMKE